MGEIVWRNSTLTTLQLCGEKFRRSEIEREPYRPTPSTIRGTIIHRVAKTALRRKLGKDNRALPSDEEARDLAATWFDDEWGRSDVRFVPGDDEDGAARNAARDAAKDFAVAVSAFHVAELAPKLDPIAIERKIIVKPKNSDLTIHGTLDIITKRGGFDPDAEAIRDLKSSLRSPKKTAANDSQQLSMYGLIRYAEKRTIAESLDLDYLVRSKRGVTKYVHLESTRDATDFDAIVERINVATEAVKKGIFVPADPSAWWCSEKWCQYWTTCPYTRRTRRPTS